MLSNTNHNPVPFEERTKGTSPVPKSIITKSNEDGVISKVVPLSEINNPYSSLKESDFSLRSSLRNGIDMRLCKPLFSSNGISSSSARDIIDKNHEQMVQQQQQIVTNNEQTSSTTQTDN